MPTIFDGCYHECSDVPFRQKAETSCDTLRRPAGTKAAIVVAILALSVTIALADETLDGPSDGAASTGGKQATVRQGMHACPEGRYVTGVQDAKNLFLCSTFPGASYVAIINEHIEPFFGTIPHSEQGMHACPKGSVMSGLHTSTNQLLCVPSPLDPLGNDPSVVRVIDQPPGTKRSNMHTCPLGRPMAGIQVARMQVLCETREIVAPRQ
jgi:hypothetical protein